MNGHSHVNSRRNYMNSSTGSVGTSSVGGGISPIMATTPISSALAMKSQLRMEQLLDDQDHKRCSEGNQRALLAEKLERLRGLVKTLEADDWKYSASQSPFQIDVPSDFPQLR